MPDADYLPQEQDHADTDAHYLAEDCASIDKQYEKFTPSQGRLLREALDTIQAMLLRVEQ